MLPSESLLFILFNRHSPGATLFPYTTLFRSLPMRRDASDQGRIVPFMHQHQIGAIEGVIEIERRRVVDQDRKSTRLNSSHVSISYAVFCLKKKSARCIH